VTRAVTPDKTHDRISVQQAGMLHEFCSKTAFGLLLND